MSFSDLFTSDAVLGLVATGLATFWTALKGSEWYNRARNQRYRRAITALEAGVDQTYRSYVRAIKDAHEDGKLTAEERRRARALARQTAINFGQTEGIDVVRELGQDYIDLWISRLVRKAKAS